MDRNIQPGIRPLKSIASIAPVRCRLTNGVPVCILNSAEQEVVRLDLVFKGGRWNQRRKMQSLFTNRMLREGTSRYSAAMIAEILDYYGAWLELSTSADYEYITLYSLCKHFDRTVDIVESMIKEPAFPEKEFNIIVDTNRRQWLINMTKMDFIARRELMRLMYGKQHPCGNLNVEEDYTALTAYDLQEFHKAHYHSDGCAIFISGKVTDDILRRLEACFGYEKFGMTTASHILPVYSIETSKEKMLFIERPEAMQNSLKLGAFTIGHSHPDYLKSRVLMELFGGYFGCRLMTNIRENKGYTYGISANVSHQPDSSMMLIDTETDCKFVGNLIKEINNEIDRLHNELVSSEELNIVKNYMTGEMCRSYDSPFSLADLWIFTYTSGLDDDFLNRSVTAIEETTPEDILMLAQRHLRKEDMRTVVVGSRV
jgi:predicted Zn-dependent peptidase